MFFCWSVGVFSIIISVVFGYNPYLGMLIFEKKHRVKIGVPFWCFFLAGAIIFQLTFLNIHAIFDVVYIDFIAHLRVLIELRIALLLNNLLSMLFTYLLTFSLCT